MAPFFIGKSKQVFYTKTQDTLGPTPCEFATMCHIKLAPVKMLKTKCTQTYRTPCIMVLSPVDWPLFYHHRYNFHILHPDQLIPHLHILLLQAYLEWLKNYLYLLSTNYNLLDCHYPVPVSSRDNHPWIYTTIDDNGHSPSPSPPTIRPPRGQQLGIPLSHSPTIHPMLSITSVLQVHNNYCDLMTRGYYFGCVVRWQISADHRSSGHTWGAVAVIQL